MQLVEELGCGKVVPGMADAYPQKRTPQTFTFEPSKINSLLGLTEEELPAAEINAYLNRIGVQTDGNTATISTHRADITAEADLAEEVGRFYGLNRIPSRYVQTVDSGQSGKSKSYGPSRSVVSCVRQTTAALGYYEAKTYPFESTKVFDKLLLPAGHPNRNAMVIKNPLGEDMGIMRTISLNGLLESLSRNFNNSNESAHLFEIARTYHVNEYDPTGLPREPLFLTIAAYAPDMDFLTLKGDIEELLATLNINNIGFACHSYPYTHPGYTALIQTVPTAKEQAQGQTPALIGYLAQLHPQVCENYNIGTKAYVAVLCMEALDQLAIPRASFTPPSVFPALTRDLALIVPETVTSAEVETAIRERGGQLLAEIKLFDIYQGPQIESGYKSMAYTLKFRAKDRTLTDKDAQKSIRGIVDNLQKKLNVQVRDK